MKESKEIPLPNKDTEILKQEPTLPEVPPETIDAIKQKKRNVKKNKYKSWVKSNILALISIVIALFALGISAISLILSIS